MRNTILVTLALLSSLSARAASVAPPRPPTVQQIAAGYLNFDINRDGVAEINSITLMDFEPVTPIGTGSQPLALVLVEPRLLASPSAEMNATVRNHLINYRDDLVREGYRTRFLLADVYRGALHQDGRTLLAIRRFLRSVYTADAMFKGVTLVGSFPEATLFRRVLFRSVENNKQFLMLHPERINPRADIVLGDLDGNWENLYQFVGDNEHLKVEVPSNIAFPFNGQILSGTVSEIQNVHWEDIFYVAEDFVTRVTAVNGVGSPVTVVIDSTAQRNPELTSADLALPNPLARPEILISRLDARGIAVNPTGPIDRLGRPPLDPSGHPQVQEFDSYPISTQYTNDPLLEQRVIADYFYRNHGHRLGIANGSQYRTTAVTELNSGLTLAWHLNQEMRKADPAGLMASIEFDPGNMFNYIMFLREPSVLRGIASHSNGRGSQFADVNNPYLIELALGGTPWAWDTVWSNGHWVSTPSAKPIGGWADWKLARSLWENKTLQFTGQAFYLHDGCSITVPDENWPDVSYDDDRYGLLNNADSLMFFQNGLALFGRGKVFYDSPKGYADAIAAAGGRFGYGWRGTFNTDGSNAALKPGTNGDARVLSNKKTYFWNLRGDWTVKLKY